MKTAAKSKSSSRKATSKKVGRKRTSGQPIKNDRYIYLIVDNTKELAGALKRLVDSSDSQKDAVQDAILRAARKV